MRRKDKEITDRQAIDTIIRGSEVCHLALALDNEPYLVPMSFGYDGQAIYLHSAQEGRKIGFFEGNNQVCFEFEHVGKLLRPEGEVCGWTVPYLSVIGTSAKGMTSIYTCDFTHPSVLIVGNETHGMSGFFKELSDMIISIPMQGNAGSLNAAAATSIVIYEYYRQNVSNA